ncbi:Putative tyrosine-protein kinase, active [Colletotrichum destructivum]|uniref:EKC/KEOPS complex subunit BUD32 n=1 Tax=Colletotrichum destructivum TaxID=34406 RepID=A0AAX4J581_9PEZI|nr:Putative tyrosine-protein kinase, active [Colletotrichum destructivum]
MDGSMGVEELTRRLREAEQRAERERQRAERERQRAEREQQRAEEAERERQEERQRAEREQQRAEEAERERQEERQRAEREQQRAEREQQRAEASEQQTQPTTLDEYIAACHSCVFSSFDIERNPKLTSKGPITNPRNKWCPTNLRPWPDFIQQQRITFGTLYDTFPTDSRVFENRAFLVGLGNRISKRRIADEKTLEYFLHNSVEDPVRAIIDQLKEVEEVRSAFHLGNGIVFENHPHAISDLAEEVVDRDTPSTPPSTPDHGLDLNQLRPDQICVYRSNNAGSARRTMVYISEYKPPHKLTAPHLRLGLRPMNIYKDVVNRKTIPTSVDPDARFQYHAERLTAAAITQTYHYMIEGGLEYGLLTTGEAIVFLKIDWREPETLFYHLAEPGAEVLAHPNHLHLCTAVGQYLAFSLMALGLPGERRLRGQDERRQATEKLKTWLEDFETTLRSIPEDERQAPDSSPGYQPEAYEGVDRSPCLLRGKRRRRVGEEPVREHDQREPGESSDDEAARDLPDTPSPTERRVRQEGRGGQGTRRSERILARRPRGGGGGGGGSNEQDRPYCTQKCLLGLVNGRILDARCPNMALHNRQPENPRSHCRGPSRSCVRHPIDHAQFLELLWEQLERTLDDGITPLGQGGARGVLFKVSLLAYGYTFVSKGTVRAFVKDLEHEAAVYERLQPIQGIHVPVFLGAIDLRLMDRIYYYDHRVYVVHMTFLSWGGYDLDSTGIVGGGDEQLEGKAMRSLRAIHQQGVVHKDVRTANMLFNAEINGVMMIDFERAMLLEPPRRPLAQLVPNKRRWKPEAKYSSKSAQKSSDPGPVSRAVSEDIGMMKMVFGELCHSLRTNCI